MFKSFVTRIAGAGSLAFYQVQALEDRLRERFEAGLVADIGARLREHPPRAVVQCDRAR